MSLQVCANYDFVAQPGSGELTIRSGETLTVLRQGIEGGWMEGQNVKGKIGLFPESYVTTAPVFVPPFEPVPPLPSLPPAAHRLPPMAPLPTLPPCQLDPWDSAVIAPSYVPPAPAPAASSHALAATIGSIASASYPQLSNNFNDNDFDDDWTDEDEDLPSQRKLIVESNRSIRNALNTKASLKHLGGGSSSDLGTCVTASTGSLVEKASKVANCPPSRTASDSRTDLSDYNDYDTGDDGTVVDDNTLESLSNEGNSRRSVKEFTVGTKQSLSQKVGGTSDSTSYASKSQSGTAKMKTINRFSNFVKTGMESYILAASRLNTQPQESYQIIFNNNLIEWSSPAQFYTCVVSKPKKESKLKGLKSFIAYSLICSLSGIQVSRRYKHFDWLHDQLSNKFLLIPIPPLPEKHVAGRYEEDLIEHRKNILQLWVNKICRHPVLGQSEVWKHFIKCTDPGKWKAGKRAAEKDEYVGGNFFHCITAPKQSLDSAKIEQQVENYAKWVRTLDDSIRELHDCITVTQKRLIGPYKLNWQKMAIAFELLGKSWDVDQSRAVNPVKDALKTSAQVLHKIGSQHEDSGKRGLEPILDYLYTYKGLYTNLPEIVNVHKSALSKMRDNERLKLEGKLSPMDADTIRERVDVTTYSMMAEINHLNQERDNDFRQMFGAFFAQQSAFYTEIGRQMAELAEIYQKAV